MEAGLTPAQRQAIDRLDGQVSALGELLTSILWLSLAGDAALWPVLVSRARAPGTALGECRHTEPGEGS